MYTVKDYFTGELIGYADTFDMAKAISDSYEGSEVLLDGEYMYANVELPF